LKQALSGIKILDFGHYIAGPYTAMLLAEQGAEVIKAERPEGDPFRNQPGFLAWNRSKKGIRLDLKKAEGQRIAHELAKRSDVIIENFHPGVADRLGIGYETIGQLNPRIVYCSISGFGPSGPYRNMPGWDPIVASMASVYVSQAGKDNPPLFLVSPLPSYYAALIAAFSVTTALYTREITGIGQKVDVSMFNSILASASIGIVGFEGIERISGIRDPQGTSPLYRLYQGSDDKWFFLGIGNLTFFTKFALAMGHEEWLTDPLFEGAPFLIVPPRSTQLITTFKDIFSAKTRDEWLEFLRAADIPCAPAQTTEEFINDPQVLANDMVVTVKEPHLGEVREMGVPVKLPLTPGQVKGPSPALGQHTEETLTDIGYSTKEIARLKDEGVI
jgi:crotonobetainyl-CoA:carnitine CoA-transferase CaiB-like acyl-CoA transferase